MKAYLRALRYIWPYRYLVVLAWLLAIVVAALYFVNIGSALPLFQMFFDDHAGVTIGTHKVADSAEGGGKVARPYVIVPPRCLGVQRDQSVWFDEQQKILHVPEGYDLVPGGLEKFVKESEGKFYHAAVAWTVARLPKGRVEQITAFMTFIVAITGLRSVLRFLNGWLVGFIACRGVLAVQERAYDKVLRLPLTFFHRGGAAEASSRLINDAFALREGIQAILGKVVMEPLMALASLLLAIYYAHQIDDRILIIAFVFGPLCVWVLRTYSLRMRRIYKKGLETAARILGLLGESLSALRVVKAYAMEGYERRRFFGEARRYLALAVKAAKTHAASGPSLEFLGTLAVALAIVLTAYILSDRAVQNPGLMISFFIALLAMLDPLRKLADVNTRIQAAVAGSERLFQLIDAAPEQRQGTGGVNLPRLTRELVFEDVHFRYDREGEEVLRGVSLRVKAGETVAIVGRTGCGKTTLVNLIARFYSPTSGRILIDGHELETVTLRSLRDQIGLVTQETLLFADTVAANIAYGSRPAVRLRGQTGRVEREQIVAAAQLAHAHEFIEKLPQGYDSVIGTLGQTLSGGQRQRLALARAIIRDPAILILDEATSALDEQTQNLVQDTLEKFVRGRMVFIVAHRLSTIALANRVVVMEAGRIADVGTHEQLMSRCEVYRRLRETGFESA